MNNDDQINPIYSKTAQTESLQESQKALKELENIYSSAYVGLCVLDKELRYVRINDRLAEMNGIPAADHIGRTVREIIPSIADGIEELARRVFASGKPELGVEFCGTTRAQEEKERYWSSHWLPMTDYAGAVTGINVVIHEITELKRMEKELKRAYDELELRVQERTAELKKANKRLEEENRERIRSEQILRLEERRLEALFRLSQISEAPLGEIANFTLEQCIELTDSKIGFLGSLNADEAVYTLHAVSKDIVKECNITGDPLQWHIPNAGIWADAIRKRKSLFVNDYSKPHPSKKGLPPGHPSVERLMVVPIVDDGKIRIVAGVGNKTSDYDNSDERQLVLLLSSMWNYTQKKRSQEELQKAYGELEEKVAHRTAQLEASARELRASQNDLNRAQEVGQIGSWRLDLRRNILTWSDESYRICGIPKGTPQTYQTFLEIVHPDDRQYFDRKWRAAMRGEPYDIEHRIVVGDQVKWLREKAYLEFDDEGKVLGGFGTAQDITDRKQMEEELRQSRNELEMRIQERTRELSSTIDKLQERSNQLRRITAELTRTEQRERQRLAQMLHDGLQQILVGASLQIEYIRHSENISNELDRLKKILDEASDTSRSLAMELSPPILLRRDFPRALKWLAGWMRDTHGLNVNLKYPEDMPPLAEEILLVLFHSIRELLFNIVKHAEVRQASLKLNQQEGQIQITVEDKGAGFDADMLQVKSAGQGGFGLSSVRERLALMGGRMKIDSAVGRGTQIRLTAPLSVVTTMTDQTSIIEQTSIDKVIPTKTDVQRAEKEMKIRIMLVDDHEIVRKGVANLISIEPDFQIVGEASDGESAVSLARETRPDVILMDVNMPGMDGIQATRIICDELKDVRIIGFSVYDEELHREAMLEAGAVDNFCKRGSAKDLLQTIRSHF